MDKESQYTKTPWRRPAKGKFIALIPNDAGIIEPVEINTGKKDGTLGEVRRAVYRQALEVAQWAREALDETPQTPENEQWRQGLIWIGELGVDVMNIVNSPGINKPGTVLDLDIIVDIYQLALSCSFIGRCHQLAELADVLTKDQLQRAMLSEVQKLKAELADHDARTTADHREQSAKLAGLPAFLNEARDDDAKAAGQADAYRKAYLKLTERQKAIYKAFEGDNKPTQMQLAALLGVKKKTISRDAQVINAIYAKVGRVKPIVWRTTKRLYNSTDIPDRGDLDGDDLDDRDE